MTTFESYHFLVVFLKKFVKYLPFGRTNSVSIDAGSQKVKSRIQNLFPNIRTSATSTGG